MGEITLEGAIALLASDKLKARSDGLAGWSPLITLAALLMAKALTLNRSQTYTTAK